MRKERVSFEFEGASIVGDLHLPDGEGPHPAVILDGPLTSVKEQATGHYAAALAERGYAALAIDHRFFGESGGAPRQLESPPKKIEDAHAALSYLGGRSDIDGERLAAVGICAGGGYMAGAVAGDSRVKAFGAVAGFFHSNAKQREWMGDGYDKALEKAAASKARYEADGTLETIPAVGTEGEVAMPMDEAFAYYGTARGAHANYVNEFAVQSRLDTLPYDAHSAATKITAPTVLVHSEKALAPALARSFFEALGAGDKQLVWHESEGQIDFYDDPKRIGPAADVLTAHFERVLSAE